MKPALLTSASSLPSSPLLLATCYPYPVHYCKQLLRGVVSRNVSHSSSECGVHVRLCRMLVGHVIQTIQRTHSSNFALQFPWNGQVHVTYYYLVIFSIHFNVQLPIPHAKRISTLLEKKQFWMRQACMLNGLIGRYRHVGNG